MKISASDIVLLDPRARTIEAESSLSNFLVLLTRPDVLSVNIASEKKGSTVRRRST